MNFEKNKIVLAILIVLCLISLTFAIKITGDIYENKRMNQGEETQGLVSLVEKTYKKLFSESKLYFNGLELNAKAYTYENDILVPYDVILKMNNSKFRFINTDDIFTFIANEKEIKINIATDTLEYGGEKVVSIKSLLRDGHVYLPAQFLLETLKFNLRNYSDKKEVFLYNNKDFEAKTEGIRTIIKSSDNIKIVNLADKSNHIIPFENDTSKIFFSKYLNRYYILNDNKIFDTLELRTQKITKDLLPTTLGQHLYKYDKSQNSLILYDINGSEIYKINNISNKLQIESLIQRKVNKFTKTNFKTEIYLEKEPGKPDLVLIDKKGQNLLILQNAIISTNEKNIVFFKDESLWLYSIESGKEANVSNYASSPSWVTQNIFTFKAGGLNYIYDIQEGVKEEIKNEYKFIGNTEKGVYYKNDSKVMFSGVSNTKEIFETQILIKEIYNCFDENNFVIIPEKPNESIYLFKNGEIRKIGGKVKVDNEDNIRKYVKVSPDGNLISLIESEGDRVTLKIIDLKNQSKDTSYKLDLFNQDLISLNLEWLNNNVVLCYSKQKGFIINTYLENSIYSWNEEIGSTQEGVFLKIP